jgi:phosphopantetheine--protein transferase-like protein
MTQFSTPEAFSCCLLDGLSDDFLHAHGKIWQRVLAHLVLSCREREIWRSLKGPDRRQSEWLRGRAVVKDAVRRFLKTHYGIALCPADIEISQDQHGRPLVGGLWTQEVEHVPVVSLAHASGIAIAVAGNDGQCCGIGIDIERIGQVREEFADVAFTPEEQSLLSLLEASAKEEWLLRFWCAKEAVAKALGRGMNRGPRCLVVQQCDVYNGIVQVALSAALAQEFPQRVAEPISAYTTREGDLIVASAYWR